MGIRVNKVIGYGVKNLKYRRRKWSVTMTDPRVDWKKLEAKREQAWGMDQDKFKKWVIRNLRWLRELYQRENPCYQFKPKDIKFALDLMLVLEAKWRLDKCVVHDDEYGSPGVLVIKPPHCGDWHRHDDIIDYVEETEKFRQRGRTVMLSGAGIYPYSSGWVRFRDPPKGMFEKGKLPFCTARDAKGPVSISPGDYNQLVGKWDPKQKPWAKGEILKHYKNDWRPSLPFSLVAVVAWFNCFDDIEAFIDDLRPMLHVYWG